MQKVVQNSAAMLVPTNFGPPKQPLRKPLVEDRRALVERHRDLQERDFVTRSEENFHLRETVKDLEKIIKLLKEEKERLLSKLAERLKDIDWAKELCEREAAQKHEKQLHEFNNALGELRLTISEREKTIEGLKSDCVEANRCRQTALEDIDRLTADLERLKRQLVELGATLAEVRAEAARSEQLLSAARAEAAASREEVIAARHNAEVAERERDEAVAAAATSTSKAKASRPAKAGMSDAEEAELVRSRDELRDAFASLQARLSQSDDDAAARCRHIESSRSLLQDQVAQLQSDIAALESQLATAQRLVSTQQDMATRAAAALRSSEDAAAAKETSFLEAIHAAETSHTAREKEQRDEIAALRSRLAVLQSEASTALEFAKTKLLEQDRTLQACNEAKAALSCQLQQVTTSSDEARREFDRYKRNWEATQEEREHRAALLSSRRQREVEDLSAQVDAATSRCQLLVANHQRELAELRAAVASQGTTPRGASDQDWSTQRRLIDNNFSVELARAHEEVGNLRALIQRRDEDAASLTLALEAALRSRDQLERERVRLVVPRRDTATDAAEFVQQSASADADVTRRLQDVEAELRDAKRAFDELASREARTADELRRVVGEAADAATGAKRSVDSAKIEAANKMAREIELLHVKLKASEAVKLQAETALQTRTEQLAAEREAHAKTKNDARAIIKKAQLATKEIESRLQDETAALLEKLNRETAARTASDQAVVDATAKLKAAEEVVDNMRQAQLHW